jgi:hypothetical protein
VPPQDCEMRFAHRLHGMPYTHLVLVRSTRFAGPAGRSRL